MNKTSFTIIIVFFIIIHTTQAQQTAYHHYPETACLSQAVSGFSFPENIYSSGLYEQISDSINIPLKRAGNLLLIETVIDGIQGHLIFDSGAAAQLVLNKTYFRDRRKTGSRTTRGITGNLEETDIITINGFKLSDKQFTDISADVTDLSHIENRKGIKILGFFGLELIHDFEIVIDVNNNELKLINREHQHHDKEEIENSFDYSQKITIVNNIIFIQAIVGGKELKFCFDTGAEKNVFSFSLPQKIMNTFTFTGRINLSGAGSNNKEVLCGVINDFILGTRRIKNMTAIFTDLSGLSEVYGVEISGVLGFEFLTIGKISINCNKNLLGIDYNS
jgi:hypothetical protein